MANVLSEDIQEQIRALGRLGWSIRRIHEELGVDREAASRCLKAAGIAIRPSGRWGHDPPKPAIETIPSDGKPAIEPILGESENGRRNSSCEPYREWMEEQVRLGRNATSIWQELVDEHDYPHRYAAVARFVRRLKEEFSPDLRAVISTAPGEEVQVDYGTGPRVRDPQTGKYRPTRLFVMTLGYSRKSVRLLTFRSSSETWSRLHEKAFRRLGGAPKLVVLDNLKEGVLRPDVYDATLNPLYRDVLKHYGVTALPCRVRDPDRKGKVESGVAHAQKTPLRGKRFESLEEAQKYLDRWEARWADTRIHGTTKRRVSELFAEEKPLLTSLPVEPFRFYRHGTRVVNATGHVEVEAAYYEAPATHVRQSVTVQFDGTVVRILDRMSGQLLIEHRKRPSGPPRSHPQARRHDETSDLLMRAKGIGGHIATLCAHLYAQNIEVNAHRSISGLLKLASQHGKEHVDRICGIALEAGAPTYRFVREYLARHPAPQQTLAQLNPLIRDLTAYRDVVHQIVQQQQQQQQQPEEEAHEHE